MKKLFFILYGLSFLFFSCATSPEKKINSAYVMVYNFENEPVMDAEVFVDDNLAGVTDIYGRLMFPPVREKTGKKNKKYESTHTIKVQKKGYETVSITGGIKAGQVFYFKTGTAEYYAAQAEESLDNGDFDDALKMINAALLINERKDYLYLKKVIEERAEK